MSRAGFGQGAAGAGPGRVHPPGDAAAPERFGAEQLRPGQGQARFRPGQRREPTGRPGHRQDQSRLHQGHRAVRRRRSPRIWSRSASWSASPARPSSPRSSSSTRSTSPSTSASRTCCDIRANAQSKRHLTLEEIKQGPARGRADDRGGLSAQGHARLRLRPRSTPSTGTSLVRGIFDEPRPRPAARLLRARPRAAGAGAERRAAGARSASSARTRPAATCWWSTRTMWSSSASVKPGQLLTAALRVITSGLTPDDRVVVSDQRPRRSRARRSRRRPTTHPGRRRPRSSDRRAKP